MSKKYFVYLGKKYWKPLLLLVAFLMLFYPLTVLLSSFSYVNFYDHLVESDSFIASYFDSTNLGLYMSTIALLLGMYIIPIVIRSKYLSKRQCDLYFSLPIKREKLYITSSVFGYLCYMGAWILTFFIGMLFTVLRGFPVHYGYYFLYLLSMILVGTAVYLFTSFFASLGNNKFDCFVLVIISLLLPLLFYATLIFNNTSEIVLGGYYLRYSILPIALADKLTSYFACHAVILPEALLNYIEVNGITYQVSQFYPSFSPELAAGMIAFPIISLILGVLGVFVTKHFKAEDSEEPSKNWFSMKLFLPLVFTFVYGVIAVSQLDGMINLFNMLITEAIFTVVYFGICFLYQRKIKLSLWLILSYVGVFVVGNLLGVLLQLQEIISRF